MASMKMRADENDSYLKPGMKDEKEPAGVMHGKKPAPKSAAPSKKAALKNVLAKKYGKLASQKKQYMGTYKKGVGGLDALGSAKVAGKKAADVAETMRMLKKK